MNEDKEIISHLEKLPKSVQDFISSGVWEERVMEISGKYSLNSDQSSSLSNIVLLTLTLTIEPENIKTLIIEDLGVSDLLSEQIANDLESRVFEYILKQVESNTNNSSNKQAVVPEIRPANLPMQGNNFIPPKPQLQNETLDRQKLSFASTPRYSNETASQNSSQNIIGQKLSSVTPSTNERPKTPPTPVKYERDPYREPLI